MLSMLVDEHGRLLTTSYAIVSEFSEEVAQEITEELVTELGVGGGKLKLHCYGSDIREDTTKSLAGLSSSSRQRSLTASPSCPYR